MSTRTPGAVLWDMDGTIVDTEPIWLAAQQGLMQRHDLPPLTPEHDELLVGASMEMSADLFISLGVPMSKREIIDSIQFEVADRIREGVEWRPGARELLRDLSANRVPTALVTNSGLGIVQAVLEILDDHTFDVIVSADDVEHGKPHPEPFLTAAKQLGVDTRDTVAIEDSINGLGSAVAANCVVLAVPHAVAIAPRHDLIVHPTLQGVGWAELSQLFADHLDRRFPLEGADRKPSA
ncbi:HAD family phosphatase [Gulosibacter macacae]|uniref:HAD family phosphatase n=1 Tax=Gulosibacter macacae TaxID=2488791 RepID=A0A3P3VXG5_9MICO|nr:HAD family phosphatase [Gulosibacter macacae]RRJ87174.1 HAD family phosphatase [Gulosibacter macacae]